MWHGHSWISFLISLKLKGYFCEVHVALKQERSLTEGCLVGDGTNMNTRMELHNYAKEQLSDPLLLVCNMPWSISPSVSMGAH